MSIQLQSKMVVLEKIEHLTAIKNEPPESEIVEIGIDDILDSSDEESIEDIKDIEIVSHELSEDLIKSETISENILENNHPEYTETQIFVKTENNPFIETENITQSENLNKTENTSDGHVNRGTGQGLIEVQGSNEHFNAFTNQTDKQHESITLAKDKNACDKNKSTHKKHKARYCCEKCTYASEISSHFKLHQLTHKTKAEIDDRLLKYRCDKCKYKSFRHQDFKVHKLIHLKPEESQYLYCYHCSYKCKRKRLLKTHIFRHFKNEDVPFHCYICDFVTLKRVLIIEHFKTHPKHHSKWDETEYKYQLPTCNKRYCCEKCTYTSGRSSNLKLHQLTHKTKAEIDDRLLKYRCDKCKYKTFRYQNFKVHKLIHLKPEEIRYFYCYHCSYKCKQKIHLKTHIFRHFKNEDVPFHCYICDFVTLKRDLIIEHFKTHPKHHSEWDETEYKYQLEICNKRYCCEKCTYTSGKSSYLKLHQLIHKTKAEIDDRLLKYHCDKCKYKTFRHEAFKRHKLIHLKPEELQLKYRCDKCKYKTFRHEAFKVHKLIHLKPEESQYFYCYHCSYKCKQKSNLKPHIFRHFKNEDVRFHCYICDFVTLKRDLIIEHFKTHPKHHSKWDETEYKYQLEICNKRYCCEKCTYTSGISSHFKLHQLTHKTKAEIDDRLLKYRCDKCKYKTFRHQDFKRHKLIHLKPEEIQYFYCYHCSYKCKEKRSLKSHIFRHFKNEDVPFHCYICDFGTLKRVLIIEHFKTHPKHHSKWDETEYKYQLPTCNKRYCCEKCTYTSGRSSNLKLHQLTHKTKAEIDDRLLKHRCDKCKYKTYRYQNFKRHKLIHLKLEEIQYFYCYHCSYKCKQKGGLKNHIFRHFKNEDVRFHCYICDFVTLKRDLIIEHFKTHPKHHSKYDEIEYISTNLKRATKEAQTSTTIAVTNASERTSSRSLNILTKI